jgi:Arc/MetJ-type ribon-helix-helix transcriptional regulator
MTIQVPHDLQSWFASEVHAGHFASVEEAIAFALRSLRESDPGDIAWAKPLMDEARQQAERGQVLSHDEFRARMRARIEALEA